MDSNIYKERLTEMLAEISTELKTIGIHNPENSSDWIAVPESLDTEEPDENLSADAVEEWNERASLVATFEKKYNDIVTALQQIEANTFGKCVICGNDIEETRLNANPTAHTCITHLNEVEN